MLFQAAGSAPAGPLPRALTVPLALMTPLIQSSNCVPPEPTGPYQKRTSTLYQTPTTRLNAVPTAV